MLSFRQQRVVRAAAPAAPPVSRWRRSSRADHASHRAEARTAADRAGRRCRVSLDGDVREMSTFHSQPRIASSSSTPGCNRAASWSSMIAEAPGFEEQHKPSTSISTTRDRRSSLRYEPLALSSSS